MNSHCFKLHRSYSISFNLSNVEGISGLNPKGRYLSLQKAKDNFCVVFTYSVRPIHTRGFAPGAYSSLILHVSVHTRERYLPRELAPKYLTVKYRGAFYGVEILLPRTKYTHEIVCTHAGTLLPERAPGWSMLREQNPLRVSTFRARKIRRFHVAVVQRRLRNLQKSVMHVQRCCFANLNLSPLCLSRSLSSLLLS